VSVLTQVSINNKEDKYMTENSSMQAPECFRAPSTLQKYSRNIGVKMPEI